MGILSTLYKRAAGIPLGAAIIMGIILCVTHDGSHYKSEWSTDDGFVLTVGMMIFLSCIISMLSLFLLLNRYDVIKKNKILSFLSWSFLPSTLCIVVIYLTIQEIIIVNNGTNAVINLVHAYIISIATLHLASLVITFIIFRRSLSKDFPETYQTKHNDLLTY